MKLNIDESLLNFAFNYNSRRYSPGSPLSRRRPDGTYIMAQVSGPLPADGWKPPKAEGEVVGKSGDASEKETRLAPGAVEWSTGVTLILEGEGASDKGDRPFVDLLNLDTGATRRLWECPVSGSGALERPARVVLKTTPQLTSDRR